MRPRRMDVLLSSLDKSLRWTGIPARVAESMSDAQSGNRKNQPLRWIPIWLIAFSCAQFILSLFWRWSALNVIWLSLSLPIVPLVVPFIHMNGPLGNLSIEDDEREAALRKDSFLFCLALLVCLNCLGQPFLLVVSQLRHWQFDRIAVIAMLGLMLNAALFGSLPTLYASWNLRPLSKE